MRYTRDGPVVVSTNTWGSSASHVFFFDELSSSGVNRAAGTVRLETCPSRVGSRAVGSIDTIFMQGMGDPELFAHPWTGTFDMAVVESDASLACAEGASPCEAP